MSKSKRFFALTNIGARYAVVIGGREKNQKLLDQVERLDITKGNWRELPSLVVARECHAACTLNNIIYVFCGFAERGASLNSFEKLPIRTNGTITA